MSFRVTSLPSFPVGLGIIIASGYAAAAWQTDQGVPSWKADSAAVAEVVERYHRALVEGDTGSALGALAGDAVILESGEVETREEYRAHHLAADIEFARAVPSSRGLVRVAIDRDAAWAVSTAKTQGSYHGRPIDSQGAELMVLTRDRERRWEIRAIHWSSHAMRPSR